MQGTSAPTNPSLLKIKVEGSGNIHSINCPSLTDASNWKLYPPNKLDPSQNTRTTQGTVEFQQMLRPIAQTDAIPSFELTFFDPSTQQYKTVTTAPIPLEWKASAITGASAGTGAPATPPPAGTIPVAEMTDIYGMAPAVIMNTLTSPAHWGWYFLAYIPAVVLLGMALTLHPESAEGKLHGQGTHALLQKARLHPAPGKLHGIPARRRQLHRKLHPSVQTK